MAWQKQSTRFAKVSNTDLRADLYFSGMTVSTLRFRLYVETDDEDREVGDVAVDSVLTTAERATLNGLLVKLRDASLSAAGFSDL